MIISISINIKLFKSFTFKLNKYDLFEIIWFVIFKELQLQRNDFYLGLIDER